MMERVDRLTAPPVVGSYYLVPVIMAKWNHHLAAWPVMGSLHSDAEFFEFKEVHYHIDGRFLSRRLRKEAEETSYYSGPAALQAIPLHAYRGESPLPKPVLARRRCVSAGLPYEHGGKKPIEDLRAHFAGAQCERGKGGWICPHRKASLGSVEVIDGVITCPLHGLRFDAATGVALPPTESK